MEQIFDVIRRYRMIEPGMHVITGVSGGADSVCLLFVLTEYRKQVPFELTAVHVEHGLRGAQSLEDVAFTEQLCRKLGVPCRVVSAQVREVAGARGLSLEEAGRTERYRIFEEVREACAAERIAVAHNQNDQAETVLWNLVRGSGLKGLGGIRPVRGNVIRPLLFTGRRDIERILQEAGLTWRTDRTNLEQEYTRNRIRLSILPQMERELNEGAVRHIAQAAGRLSQVQAYVERMTVQAAGKCLYREGQSVCIDLHFFMKEDVLIRQELLRRAVEQCSGSLKDLGSVHIGALERLALMDCGRETHLPGGVRAVREDGRIRLEVCAAEEKNKTGRPDGPPAGHEGVAVAVPGICHAGGLRVRTELMENTPEIMKQIIQEKKYTKWLSYDTIYGNVLFRTRRTGDYLVVNGQGGRKKLKDYFIDQKIPKDCRDGIWLLADGSHVLWVVGYRISEAAKVRAGTRSVIKIQLEEEDK